MLVRGHLLPQVRFVLTDCHEARSPMAQIHSRLDEAVGISASGKMLMELGCCVFLTYSLVSRYGQLAE
jgi:hypothetical protein